MSRNFLPVPFAPYKGQFSGRPFNYYGKKGTIVLADIQWGTYQFAGLAPGDLNPDVSVQISLNAAAAQIVSINWTIQSVYIDNEGVDFPVYVYFPDTQFTVSAPPNSSGWYQVFSNARQGWVTALGVTNSSAGQRTKVFFTDIQMTPFLDVEIPSALQLWLGSTTIQRTNTTQPGLGTPALGDQKITQSLGLIAAATNFTIPAFGPFAAPSFLYLTQIQVSITGFLNDGAPGVGQHILSNDITGNVQVIDATGGSNDGTKLGNPAVIFDMHGQLRFPAQANWIVRNFGGLHILGGFLIWTFVFTINPK